MNITYNINYFVPLASRSELGTAFVEFSK